MRYAFHVDSAACSGCKACVIACRDRHALPERLAWRRLHEVVGGGWRRDGDAWVNDVVAYNIPLSCNHCERAICVEVCPTGALAQRADGIVLVDAARCAGCRYCEWACPYGAPRYDAAAGVMTKCTFCAQDLDAGGSPACVAACGLRALDFGDAAELAARYGAAVPRVPPLPDPALTRPALALAAHPAAAAVATAKASRPDREDRQERPGPRRTEHATPPDRQHTDRSLVAFTLLAQLAAGLFWALLVVRGAAAKPPAWPQQPLLVVGAALAAGTLASLLHLGTPRNAWRALAGVRTSWLSRELLFTGLFGAGWAATVVLDSWTDAPGQLRFGVPAAAALAGVALVYSMARVYRLRTVDEWNTPRTTAEFLATAAVLGALAAGLLFAAGAAVNAGGTAAWAGVLVAAAAAGGAAALAVRRRVAFYAANSRRQRL
jgi:DMSO reductase iron-sulfur subunit